MEIGLSMLDWVLLFCANSAAPTPSITAGEEPGPPLNEGISSSFDKTDSALPLVMLSIFFVFLLVYIVGVSVSCTYLIRTNLIRACNTSKHLIVLCCQVEKPNVALIQNTVELFTTEDSILSTLLLIRHTT